jgi:hypothetical protein
MTLAFPRSRKDSTRLGFQFSINRSKSRLKSPNIPASTSFIPQQHQAYKQKACNHLTAVHTSGAKQPAAPSIAQRA